MDESRRWARARAVTTPSAIRGRGHDGVPGRGEYGKT
jgi:hypothetical protein